MGDTDRRYVVCGTSLARIVVGGWLEEASAAAGGVLMAPHTAYNADIGATEAAPSALARLYSRLSKVVEGEGRRQELAEWMARLEAVEGSGAVEVVEMSVDEFRAGALGVADAQGNLAPPSEAHALAVAAHRGWTLVCDCQAVSEAKGRLANSIGPASEMRMTSTASLSGVGEPAVEELAAAVAATAGVEI